MPRAELQPNPILIKELRSRMRGPRPYAMLTFFLLALIAVAFALYQIVASQARLGAPVVSATVGATLFSGLALCMIALVIFLSPAVSAGAISGERERLTYDMLLATPLKPAAIFWGKLLAALAYVFLLLMAAVPLFSMVLIFGGVTPRDVAKALALLLVTALFCGALSVVCSALLRRTAAATIVSYGLLLALIGGSLLAATLWSSTQGQQAPPALHYLNPLVALASAVVNPSQGGFGMPMMDMAASFPGGGGQSVFWLLTGSITYYGPNGAVVSPIYRATIVLYPLLTLALCWLGSHLVRTRARWHLSRSDLGFALALALGCLAAYLSSGWWVVPPPLP